MKHLRKAVSLALTLAALVVGWSALAVPAGATTSTPASPTISHPTRPSGDCPITRPPRHTQWLDGFRLGWVPPRIGTLVTDFEYEWEDVRFQSRVWETEVSEGSYRVDLQVTILRSPSFTDPDAVRDFLVGYLERAAAEWANRRFEHPDGPGFAEVGEFFWLAAPGTAVRVNTDGAVVTAWDLRRMACAVRQSVQR